MNSVTLLGGDELPPIQAGEQQSPSAVFYSATVGEDIQQPIVSYSVQYNQQYDCTLVVLHSLTFSMSKEETMEGGPVTMYSESIFPHSFHTCTCIYTEGLWCSCIPFLGVNAHV